MTDAPATPDDKAEKARRTAKIRDAYMSPAIRQAMKRAMDDGQPREEILDALMTAYQDTLMRIIGAEPTATILESQAQFIRERVIPNLKDTDTQAATKA